MKRTQIMMLAMALGAVGASAQVAWNVSVGNTGMNVNVGAPGYLYVAPPPPAYIVPVNSYYYGNGHQYKKHMKKARKYYKKAVKEARKAGWYERAKYGPAWQPAPPPQPPKGKKHHH